MYSKITIGKQTQDQVTSFRGKSEDRLVTAWLLFALLKATVLIIKFVMLEGPKFINELEANAGRPNIHIIHIQKPLGCT